MEKIITPHQRKILELLNEMINVISDAVWIAEHTDKDVDQQIKIAIWLGKHNIEMIEKENK